MLKIERLSKTYRNGKKAVNNISLEIESGDIYGFIGHNGAGKTTTIKCVTGILDFDEGNISIGGKSVKTESMECKQITAYIPDNPDLYDNMTGIGFLSFVADIYGIERSARERDIADIAAKFEITDNLGDVIASYSHGMKQKLAIISALIHKPKLMVLDEPFTGLDPKAAHTLKEYMKELCGQGGAVFFSTHVLEVAEKLCNKVAIIKEGQLVVSGPTEKVIGNRSLEQFFLELTE